MELSTWIEIGALAVSTGTILGGIAAFFKNFRDEQDLKYIKLKERIFQLAMGKTLKEAMAEQLGKKDG